MQAVAVGEYTPTKLLVQLQTVVGQVDLMGLEDRLVMEQQVLLIEVAEAAVQVEGMGLTHQVEQQEVLVSLYSKYLVCTQSQYRLV
jgi:hypothetical protein